MCDSFNSYTQKSEPAVIKNILLYSPELSCKAFKLLCIGLSYSGGWIFNKSDIAPFFKEKNHTLDGAMKELRSLGYLHLKARKNKNGQMDGHMWFWFSSPISDEEFKLFYREGNFQT